MELAQQVISLDQAKKLKELGFERDSALIWNTQVWGSMGLLENVSPYLAIRHKESTYDTSLSAYSCSELMDMLPETVDYNGYNYHRIIDIDSDKGRFVFGYDARLNHPTLFWKGGDNLTEVLGNVLIHLLENNLMPTD